MDRRTFAAAVTLGGAAALIGAQRVSAAPPPDPVPQARNVVLVHGAYADGLLTRLSTAALLNVTAGGGSQVPGFVVEPR